MKNPITIKKIIITIVITFCIGCAPKSFIPPQPKIGEPERLDITRFEDRKSKYNDYYIIDNENIKIRQYLDKFDYTYFEFIELPKEHLIIYKTYYKNGMIKDRGRAYIPGNIYIGTWEYFNEKGEFIKQEEYNYKMPLEKALRIIRRIYGYKQENLTVYLSADKERWYFENIKGKKKGKMAYIDMVTKEHGEILVGTLVD